MKGLARPGISALFAVATLVHPATATPPEHFIGKWSCLVEMNFGPDNQRTYQVRMEVDRGGACRADGYIHVAGVVMESSARMDSGSWGLDGDTFICRGDALTPYGVEELQIFGRLERPGLIKGIYNADGIYVDSSCVGAG